MHDPLRRVRDFGDDPASPEWLLSAALETSGAHLGNVQLMDWRTGHLTIAAQSGFNKPFLDHFRIVVAKDGTACGRAVRERSAVIIEDVLLDREFAPSRSFADEAGFRAVLSTPMISSSGAFVGVVSTHFSAKHTPTEAEMRTIRAAADRAANAIIAQRARAREIDHAARRDAHGKRIAKSVAAVASSYELLRRIGRD